MSQPENPEVFIKLVDSSSTHLLQVVHERVDGNTIKRCRLVEWTNHSGQSHSIRALTRLHLLG